MDSSATDPGSLRTELRLSGRLRGTGEPVAAIVSITLKLAPAGHIEIAEATIDESILQKIREARLRP
jgi:hypothetical protein